MKYQVGDKVKYHTIKTVEKTCESCGNVDTRHKQVTRTGTIEKATTEYVLNLANGVVYDNEEVQPDGSMLHRPSFGPVELRDNKVPVYRINGELMTEESIIGLAN